MLPKFIIYQRERTVAVRCVGVYKSKRNCKSARRYPCTAKRRTWVVTGQKKDGTAAMHRTLMLYVNEIGFYALNEKYGAENQLVNIHATAKRGFISIATGKKKVGIAAKHWYKLSFVS